MQQGDPAPRDRIRIQTFAGVDHLGVTSSDSALTAAAEWLVGADTSPQHERSLTRGGELHTVSPRVDTAAKERDPAWRLSLEPLSD